MGYGPNPAEDGADRLAEVAAGLTAAISLMLSEGDQSSPSSEMASGHIRAQTVTLVWTLCVPVLSCESRARALNLLMVLLLMHNDLTVHASALTCLASDLWPETRPCKMSRNQLWAACCRVRFRL